MPLQPRMDADDRAVLDALAECCEEVVTAFGDFGDRTGWHAIPLSPLQHECDAMRRKLGPHRAWDDQPARFASETALFLLPVARQHLLAAAQLLRSGQIIFSLAPVNRAVVEVLGRVAWLLDWHVNPRERAARAALTRVDDMQRVKRTALALHHDRLASKTGQRLHDLRKVEIPATFYPSEIQTAPSGNLTLTHQTLPGLRETVHLLDRLLHLEGASGGIYDFLSLATHPNLAYAFQMIRAEDAAPPDAAPGTSRYNFVLEDLTLPRRQIRYVLIAFVGVWDLVAQYHGLELDVRLPLLDRIEADTGG